MRADGTDRRLETFCASKDKLRLKSGSSWLRGLAVPKPLLVGRRPGRSVGEVGSERASQAAHSMALFGAIGRGCRVCWLASSFFPQTCRRSRCMPRTNHSRAEGLAGQTRSQTARLSSQPRKKPNFSQTLRQEAANTSKLLCTWNSTASIASLLHLPRLMASANRYIVYRWSGQLGSILALVHRAHTALSPNSRCT